jgi:hypothetical protein
MLSSNYHQCGRTLYGLSASLISPHTLIRTSCQYAEADYGWTVAGVLDNRPSAAAASAADSSPGPVGARRRGAVKEYVGRAQDGFPAGQVPPHPRTTRAHVRTCRLGRG